MVSVERRGVGLSTIHAEISHRLDFTTVAAGNPAVEQERLDRLAKARLLTAPAVVDPIRLDIRQSMGGSMTVVKQGRQHCYDGIGPRLQCGRHLPPGQARDAPRRPSGFPGLLTRARAWSPTDPRWPN